MYRFNTKIIFTTLLFLTFNKTIFSGNYFDVYGAHSRANGMANAVTSFINDVSATFYNPAGLGLPSRLEGYYIFLEKNDNNDDSKKTSILDEIEKSKDQLPVAFSEKLKYIFGSFLTPLKNYPKGRSITPIHELSLGFNYAKPVAHVHFELYDPGSPDLKKIRDNYISLGLSLNLNSLFDFDRLIRFGLYAGLPASGNLALINDVNPTAHRFLQSGVSNERPIIHSGIGIELWKNYLSLGLGVQAMLKGKGAILMKDVDITPDKTTPNAQAILELKPLIMPQYGLMFHYGRVMTGVNYRRETYAHVDPLGAQAQTTLLAIQFDFDMALLDLYSPRALTWGIGYKLLDNFKIAIDITREYWSLFRHSRTKEYVFSPLKDEFLKQYVRIPIVQFNDINVFKMGFEWDWDNPWKLPITFRGGIARKPTPVPAFYDEYNWMDNDRNIFTFGITYAFIPNASGFLKRLKTPIIIDFVIENQQYANRSIRKLNPTEKNPNYSYGGYAWNTGFTLTLKF